MFPFVGVDIHPLSRTATIKIERLLRVVPQGTVLVEVIGLLAAGG